MLDDLRPLPGAPRISDRAPPWQSPPPALSERYEDIVPIGQGGMGIVYRARDPRLGRTVALKLLKEASPELHRRFLREARAQAQVVHPHVCRVHDAGETGGVPFIAMQYIEGPSLLDVHRDLSLDQRLRVVRDIARAVHEAHLLGLVHRDIKPGNILLERQPDGEYKPYILDFGLAREVGIRGDTQTGEVIGTLAYMSPEQAQGDWRSTDPRSDVFSLGATLYHVLAGRAPFASDQPWKLLMLVAYGEVPPLRDSAPPLPPGLDTIVMKCLQRDRDRRYPTALALAEDIDRLLAAEPIQAKDPSIAHLLWKKAWKHRLRLGAALALLLAATALFAVRLRDQREAEAQARAAASLGEAVKEMELFLRTAHGLPLHDIEREREVVRARLREIEEHLTDRPDFEAGPAECALGQGYLALGDPESARAHLERALGRGYSSRALEYALGRAQGELFRRALEEARRLGEEEREQRIRELTRTLRDPALAHLQAAAGGTIESAAYAEGLIALHEGRNDAAVAKAREAFARAPWLHEAKKLEADALFAEGSKHRHDAAFDYDRMERSFAPAEEAYRAAAEIGRSDPTVHLALCDLEEKEGWARYNQRLPSDAAFDAAEAACARAVAASSRDVRAVVQQALVVSARAFVATETSPRTAEPVVERAVTAAVTAVTARPGDAMARYALARALFLRAKIDAELGREPSIEDAISAFREVLDLDPRFPWAWNELGDAHAFEADRARARGDDGEEPARLAIEDYEQAISLDPRFALPVSGRLDTLARQVESDLAAGRDATPHLAALSDAARALAPGGFGPWLSAFWTARTQRLRAEQALSLGRDPAPPLALAEAAIRGFAGDPPTDAWFREELAKCRILADRAGGTTKNN